MPQQESKQVCPYLGLAEDRDSHFSYPETAHTCFATNPKSTIAGEHQSAFCLSKGHAACPRFMVALSKGEAAEATAPVVDPISGSSEVSVVAVVLLGVTGLLFGLICMLGAFYYYYDTINASHHNVVINPTKTPTAPTMVAGGILTPTPVENTPTSDLAGSAFLATPTPTNTPEPGIKIYNLSPRSADVGWVASSEERGNHFGDSYLYAGIFEGQVYNSGFQFNLSSIPRGAPIYHGSIQLTGLREDRLAENFDQAGQGVWLLRLLDSEIDRNWGRLNYQELFNASVIETLNPILNEQGLATGRVNQFDLTHEQLRILETRIIEDEEPKVSFRIDGPLVGSDNLFAWDTGYGPQSQGKQIILSLSVGEPPATPPPFKYIVVTSTPTPENVVTAAAIAAQMTADAASIGTATPAPPNLVTATPIPEYLIIVPTEIPENEMTAQAIAVISTAEAFTTGTPTSIPTNALTATPIPTPTNTPTPTATPTIGHYVLITDTPTPATVFEAATRAVQATAQFKQFGSPTPLPTNWVTPIIVTSTPTPINAATAQYQFKLATAVAVTTGSPVLPLPNVVTATPTPVFVRIALLVTPTPTGSPTATPQPIPSVLLGKVLFRSDREGRDADDVIYVFDPETGELGRLTDNWPYFAARERNTYSADAVYRTYNKKLLWTNVEKEAGEDVTIRTPTTVYALHVYDYKYKVENVITKFGSGWVWDPVWSPTSNQIAFVSNDSADDEIWVINHDGTDVRRLTETNEAFNAANIGKDTFIPELNGHPSWSPDGSKIVFWSNRTGNRQLWIMNADGSEEQLLMGWDNWTPYNDWDPVWVKYLTPPPPEDQER